MPTLQDTVRRVLSLSREAGTPEAAKARAAVADYLSGLGYRVTLQKFTFAPSSLRAFPIFGAGLGFLALVLVPFLASPRAPAWAALAVWICGLLSLAVVAGGVGLGWVPLGEPLREDANLIATRSDQPPRRWIVAHLDSKAQGHSMAGRLVAVWMVGVAGAALTLLSVFRLEDTPAEGWLALGIVLALLAGVLAGRGRLQGASPGARDNGTGVVAALTAAETSTDPGVGILITGAEEFGLVGARVFARLGANLGGTEFVNLDTLDQEGDLYLVSHDAAGQRLAGLVQPHLVGLELPIVHRRLPLGILVDSAPLARSHAAAITIGRLTWNTLRCIHTAGDTPTDLSLETAERVGRAIASN